MRSSKKDPSRYLATGAPPAAARGFLKELANLPDDQRALDRFEIHFQSVLVSMRVEPSFVRSYAMDWEQENFEFGISEKELVRKYWLLPLREAVRAIWRAPDLRSKVWGLFRIFQDFFFPGDRGLVRTPLSGLGGEFRKLMPQSLLEQMLLQLLKSADLTRYCGNEECPAPYFFATRRSQKYCSSDCSEPAMRQQKRRWWADCGNDWRRERSVGARK